MFVSFSCVFVHYLCSSSFHFLFSFAFLSLSSSLPDFVCLLVSFFWCVFVCLSVDLFVTFWLCFHVLFCFLSLYLVLLLFGFIRFAFSFYRPNSTDVHLNREFLACSYETCANLVRHDKLGAKRIPLCMVFSCVCVCVFLFLALSLSLSLSLVCFYLSLMLVLFCSVYLSFFELFGGGSFVCASLCLCLHSFSFPSLIGYARFLSLFLCSEGCPLLGLLCSFLALAPLLSIWPSYMFWELLLLFCRTCFSLMFLILFLLLIFVFVCAMSVLVCFVQNVVSQFMTFGMSQSMEVIFWSTSATGLAINRG